MLTYRSLFLLVFDNFLLELFFCFDIICGAWIEIFYSRDVYICFCLDWVHYQTRITLIQFLNLRFSLYVGNMN